MSFARSEASPDRSDRRHAIRPWRAAPAAAVTVCILFLAGAVPLILGGDERGRGAFDQNYFHLPVIRQFARQWPHIDLSDYLSATTPGYHLALAAVERYISPDLRVLQLAGAAFTVGLLATLAAAAAPRVGATTAFVLCLPVVCSLYVFSPGVWLLPDNAGWWGVLAVLLVALRPRVDAWTYILGGLFLLLLVFVRQVHLWAAAPLCVAAWIGPGPPGRAYPTDHAMKPRLIREAAMLVAVVPSILLLAFFFHLWGGTVPSTFRTPTPLHPAVNGANPAIPATVLAVLGMLGIFYIGFLWPSLAAALKCAGGRSAVLAGVAIGALAAVLPRTSYDFAAGRSSGIWNLVRHVPTFAGRSPLMLLLSALGGGLLAAWLLALERRDRWIVAAAWVGFIAAQAAGALAWQRYYEPFALIALVLMVSRLPRLATSRAALAGPIALALLLAAVTVQSLTH